MSTTREVCPNISDETWLRLDARERALQVAAWLCDTIKVRETGGNNRGYWIKRILGSVDLDEGNPYCAAGVTFCNLKAGLDLMPVSGRGAVRFWAAWGEKVGRITAYPQRGDLGFWLNADGTGHIFRIVRVLGPLVQTIEFNTGPGEGGNQRDGDGCYRRVRLRKNLKFISLAGNA